MGAEGVTRVRVISVRCSRRREVVHGGAGSLLLMADKTTAAPAWAKARLWRAHARARTRDERDLAGEVIRKVHGCSLLGWKSCGREVSKLLAADAALRSRIRRVEWSLRSWELLVLAFLYFVQEWFGPGF